MITQTLASKYHIFDYATQFRIQNPSITDAKTFKLTDADFENFISFLSKRDYSYNSRIEKLLNEVRDEAKKESKLGQVTTELEALNTRITTAKKNDLSIYKEEIKKVLEGEIVSRYYFEKGRLEQNFKYDQDLSESLKLIANKSTLASILNGEGTYKSIGKPGVDFSASTGK
jgi:carboxyl-terminal processing protease